MNGTAAVLQQRFAEWLIERAERNRIHKFSIAGAKARADMVLPNRIGMDQRMRWKRKHWLWIARSERSRAGQQIRKGEIEAAGGNRSINEQNSLAARQLDRLR